VDFATCTKVQDKVWQVKFAESIARSGEKTFAVARGKKIAHTVSIETIKYR
jgi:hypothetical protein